ncbi:MAG: alpha-L-fucosidase [Bacteroidales bacterium]
MKTFITSSMLALMGLNGISQDISVPSEDQIVLPSEEQVSYQQMERVGFIHFTVNTFTDKEWGYGDEDPALFNPTELDAEQWARVARDAGMKELILTAKHHDGFCLWPSAYTEHSVKNSPFRNGKGDVVREFTDACRKYGLKVGLYLSPWDRNHPDYGTPEYITYYRNQLRELLTGYGEINEIWFDGANGGDGYYGGANEVRRIDRETYYDWPNTVKMVKTLQPGIKIFSDAGPDIRWVGNEHGHAGETFWSTISGDHLVIGASDPAYLNTGDPHGNRWIIGQCDVSIRPGWFYHAAEDTRVKSPGELIDIYYKSVGRNAVLLLNLPPDRRGLIHENDVESLMGFRKIIDETFEKDLAEGASFKIISGEGEPLELLLESPAPVLFDRILLQEPIRQGQRISRFRVEIENEKGSWTSVAEGTTIGYKRLLRVSPVTARRLRVVVEKSLYPPTISQVSIYKASDREPSF